MNQVTAPFGTWALQEMARFYSLSSGKLIEGVLGWYHPTGKGVPEAVRVAAEGAPGAVKATGTVRLACATGEWPSGKAADSGSANRRFESYLPSQTSVFAEQTFWWGAPGYLLRRLARPLRAR